METEQTELSERLDEVNKGKRKAEDGSKVLPKQLDGPWSQVLTQGKAGGKVNCV